MSNDNSKDHLGFNRFSNDEEAEQRENNNPNFRKNDRAYSRSEYAKDSSNDTIFKFASSVMATTVNASQKQYLEKIEDNLKQNTTDGKLILTERINYNNVFSMVYYTVTEKKISAVILLFAEGAPLTFNERGIPNNYIDIPLKKVKFIKDEFINTLNKNGNTSKNIEIIESIVIRQRDIVDMEQRALNTARKIELLLKSANTNLAEVFNVNSFKDNYITVSDTNIQQVRANIAAKNPLSYNPSVDIGFILNFKSGSNSRVVLPNFITVGATVDITPMTPKHYGDPLLRPVITITAIESELCVIDKGVLPVLMTIAYSVFIEQGLWKDIYSPENGNQYKLSDLIIVESGEQEVPYTDEYAYQRFLKEYVAKPVLGLSMTAGTYMPYGYTQLSSMMRNGNIHCEDVVCDGIRQFFKPAFDDPSTKASDREYMADQVAQLQEREFVRDIGNIFAGWYDDKFAGNDINLDSVNFVNWKFASLENNTVLNSNDNEYITDTLIVMDKDANAIDNAIVKNKCLKVMCKHATNAEFAYATIRLLFGTRFFSVVSRLCEATGINYSSSLNSGHRNRLIDPIDDDFVNGDVVNIARRSNDGYYNTRMRNGRVNDYGNDPFDPFF